MDGAIVNSFIIYDKLHPNALSFLDFKLVVSESFIGSFTTRTREFPSSRPTKRRFAQVVTNESQSHFLEYQQTRRSCAYCSIGGIENHTFAMCVICDIPLCLQKERNCFLLYHHHTNKWTNRLKALTFSCEVYFVSYICTLKSRIIAHPYPWLLIFRFFSTQDIFIQPPLLLIFSHFCSHFWVQITIFTIVHHKEKEIVEPSTITMNYVNTKRMLSLWDPIVGMFIV